MRYLNLIAMGALVIGVAGANAADWKLGVGGLTSATGLESYHMGVGGSAAAAVENNMGPTDSRIGIRGNYLNFEHQDDAIAGTPDYQQMGVGLEALIGPTGRFFEPKIGGHVGWSRLDTDAGGENDVLDVGGDVMATYKVTPRVDLQALVTPTWLIDDEDTDYETRGSVNVQIALGPDL